MPTFLQYRPLILRKTPPTDPVMQRRVAVLEDTAQCLRDHHKAYQANVVANHSRWAREAAKRAVSKTAETFVRVIQGDWGDVTLARTKATGQRYAVLNMANEYTPGGGYKQGCVAQEENMFRRTDCYLSISSEEDRAGEGREGQYTADHRARVSSAAGTAYERSAYLDTTHPRICFKGPETDSTSAAGYAVLADQEMFSFYELRSAADDLRVPGTKEFYAFDGRTSGMRRKIIAQLETLKAAGIRHVVLSAFGCGAFGNPADQIAAIYQQELAKRVDDFDDVVFAVYHAGYGVNNFPFFEKGLASLCRPKSEIKAKPPTKQESMKMTTRRTPEFEAALKKSRVTILQETLEGVRRHSRAYQQKATENHARWRREAADQKLGPLSSPVAGGDPTTASDVPDAAVAALPAAAATPSAPAKRRPVVSVVSGDWGDVTLARTKATGATYAVLNMANATTPGGGYLHGAAAQEENMWRRSNCSAYGHSGGTYTKEMTDLINGQNGVVYLDVTEPRLCLRGAELPLAPTETVPQAQGYANLAHQDIHSFYEMRAAADDLGVIRGLDLAQVQAAGKDPQGRSLYIVPGSPTPFYKNGEMYCSRPYDAESMRKKIAAQLDTLIAQGVRHAVLSAFGCGAFGNPAAEVAQLYKEALEARLEHFDDVVFAVYDAGYGPKNFEPFRQALAGLSRPDAEVQAISDAVAQVHQRYMPAVVERSDTAKQQKSVRRGTAVFGGRQTPDTPADAAVYTQKIQRYLEALIAQQKALSPFAPDSDGATLFKAITQFQVAHQAAVTLLRQQRSADAKQQVTESTFYTAILTAAGDLKTAVEPLKKSMSVGRKILDAVIMLVNQIVAVVKSALGMKNAHHPFPFFAPSTPRIADELSKAAAAQAVPPKQR